MNQKDHTTQQNIDKLLQLCAYDKKEKMSGQERSKQADQKEQLRKAKKVVDTANIPKVKAALYNVKRTKKMIYFELKSSVSFKVWESFSAPRQLLELYKSFNMFAQPGQKQKVGKLEIYKDLANAIEKKFNGKDYMLDPIPRECFDVLQNPIPKIYMEGTLVHNYEMENEQKLTWFEELKKWMPGMSSLNIQVFRKGSDQLKLTSEIVIVSYDLATRNLDKFKRFNFQSAIVDEAHFLKSMTSNRSRELVPYLQTFKRIILLTGTPMLARPNQVFNLLQIIRPDIFIDFKTFGYRYCNPKKTRYGIDWNGNAHSSELHLVMKEGIMIRRLKKHVLRYLPPKTRQKIIVELNPKDVKEISKILDSATAQFKNLKKEAVSHQEIFGPDANLQGDAHGGGKGMGDFMTAFKATGTAKINSICEFTESLLENDVKFLLFMHHHEVIDAVEAKVKDIKTHYVRIDGRMSPDQRFKSVKEFQQNPQCMLALIGITAGYMGITMTTASTVVFGEMFWTPGIMIQAEDRVHRHGQQNNVTVYYLCADKTVDTMLFGLLDFKSQVIANTLDGKKGREFKMSKHEKDQFNVEEQNLPRAKNQTQSQKTGSIQSYFQSIEKDAPADQKEKEDDREEEKETPLRLEGAKPFSLQDLPDGFFSEKSDHQEEQEIQVNFLSQGGLMRTESVSSLSQFNEDQDDKGGVSSLSTAVTKEQEKLKKKKGSQIEKLQEMDYLKFGNLSD